MSIPGVYPGAAWRPLSYADAPPLFSAPPRGWVLHVPVGNGSLFDYFDGLKSPHRKCSTGWVSKAGDVEQYVSALREPWAQVDGNGWGTAWEVEGFPNEPMTNAQLDALARLHIWLGVPDEIADTPAGRGIGTHQMGGAAWGGHACPGRIRAVQRADILTRVAALRHPKPPTPTLEDDMGKLFLADDGRVFLVWATGKRHITNPSLLAEYLKAGYAKPIPASSTFLNDFTTVTGP